MFVVVRTFAIAPLLACLVWLAGCGEVPTKKPDGGGGGSDDGNGGGGVCEASKALRCEGKMLVSCNGEGTAEVTTTCELRCNATALACENKVAPSNGYAAQLDAAASEGALNITANTTVVLTTDFNPTAGTFKVGNQQVKAAVVPGANGGPEVLVLSVNSLSVAANVTWGIFSESGSPRELAVMSAGDVSIAGTIRRGATGAPVVSEACNGSASNAAGADNDVPGGGGAGYGTAGANGGAVVLVGNGANGGTVTGNAALVPLRPGCRGGNTASLGAGGNAGGAIQITSATRITLSGAVGSPGLGGTVNAGGGSGGSILLEAPTVMLTGGVFANGGAGGCGEFSSGSDGQMSTSPALGGPCSNGQSGGNGGAGTTPPTNGQSISNTGGTTQYAPGGGGAVGRIRINTLDMTVAGTGAQSPPASLGQIGTR